MASAIPNNQAVHTVTVHSPIKTIGSVCRQQGQKLIEELILLAHARLLQGQSADEVFSRLFAKQWKEVPA